MSTISISQDREGDRNDPKCVPHPPRTPKPPWVYPPMGVVIDDTQEALFNLDYTLLQHGTVVQGNVGQGVGTSEAVPSNTRDPLTRSPYNPRATNQIGYIEGSECHVIPHPCTTRGGICYGPASEF